jgi:hypothetical protein
VARFESPIGLVLMLTKYSGVPGTLANVRGLGSWLVGDRRMEVASMHGLFEIARRDIYRDALLAEIGECLRADRAVVEEPLPERLAALINQLERTPRENARKRRASLSVKGGIAA